MNKKIFGAALLDIAKSEDCLDSCYDGFTLFKELLLDADFKHFVASPVISINEKEKVLKNALKDFNVSLIFFIKYLIESNLVFEIDEIYSDFKNLYLEERKIKEVECYSKEELTSNERTTIYDALKKKYVDYQIELVEKIDKNITEGYILYVFGKRIDASLNGSIDNLKKSIK